VAIRAASKFKLMLLAASDFGAPGCFLSGFFAGSLSTATQQNLASVLICFYRTQLVTAYISTWQPWSIPIFSFFS
jgi:hypothetical protein